MLAKTLLPAVCALALASCDSGWPSERERLFSERCLLEESARGTSPLTARAFCECALDKTASRYATSEELIENKDSVALALDLEICRRSTR